MPRRDASREIHDRRDWSAPEPIEIKPDPVEFDPACFPSNLEQVLANVNLAESSITTASVTLRKWPDRANEICAALGSAYCAAGDVHRQLALFFLFNDLVQKDKTAFVKPGLLFLQRAQQEFQSQDVPADIVHNYLKTIGIWKQRNVFPRSDCRMILTWFLHWRYQPQPTEDQKRQKRAVDRQRMDFLLSAGVFHVMKIIGGIQLAPQERFPPEWQTGRWSAEMGKTSGSALAVTKDVASSLSLTSDKFSEEQLENVPVSQLHQLKLYLLESHEVLTEEIDLTTKLFQNLQNLAIRNQDCLETIVRDYDTGGGNTG
ncbi:MAG: hypothetical protein KVP17_003760 [Porospora cf. gigantea B]|nr:MAG: hypothetical protein KVP17_003760 [Porospora cf. gigantea B]